jgi:hypothetical protein
MRYQPGGLQIRTNGHNPVQERGYAWRRSGAETWSSVVWRPHAERKEHGTHESNEGENDERKTAETANIAEGVFGLSGCLMSFVPEICLPYPCGTIEEEWKPA